MQNLTRRKPDPDDPWNFTEDGRKMNILHARSWEWILRHKTEKASILSDDGLTLRALFMINENNKESRRKIVILSHGYGGISGDMGIFARYYYSRGFDILFPDQRAHGTSEGKYITMGAW